MRATAKSECVEWTHITLGKLSGERGKSVEPAKTPEKKFELYSVPSFPDRKPEVVLGKEVGSNKQLVEPRSVLLCKINPRINRAWVVGDFTAHTKIASTEWIVFPATDDVEPEFLCYFLQKYAVRDFLAHNASGVGGSLMRVKPSTLRDFPFAYPKPKDQRRIVGEIEKQFSRLEEGGGALKRVQANLKRYRAAVLKAACEGRLVPASKQWQRRKLGEITSKIGSGSTPRGGEEIYRSTGVPLIRSMNVHSTGFRFDGLVYIDDAEAKKLDHVIVTAEDVLLNITGASIGRVTTAPASLNGARVNQHVCIIRPKQELLPSFLAMFLASPNEQARVMNVQVGATRQALTKAMVTNWEVPLPSLAEQSRIVAEVERRLSMVEELEAVVAANLQRAARLRQSILQKAFAGELA